MQEVIDVIFVTTTDLNLRDQPGVNGKVLGILHAGQDVAIKRSRSGEEDVYNSSNQAGQEVYKNGDTIWVKVTAEISDSSGGSTQLTGWVNSRFLVKQFSGMNEDYTIELRKQAPNLFSTSAALSSSAARHARMAHLPAFDDNIDMAKRRMALVQTLKVESSERYRPADGKTYCNIYATDFCYGLGPTDLGHSYLPRVWWTSGALEKIRRGETVSPVYGATVVELNANALHAWLVEYGAVFGWHRCRSTDELYERVNKPGSKNIGVITAARKDPSRSGHITVALPDYGSNTSRPGSPLQSQAGTTNKAMFVSTSKWWEGPQFRDAGLWAQIAQMGR